MAQLGHFVWYELLTTDPNAAVAFYTDVVGWRTEAWENNYTMWVSPQGPLGGLMDLPETARKMGAPPHWTSYVEVANADAIASAAKKLGGQIYVEPQNIPKIGRFAILADPQGASICILQPEPSPTPMPPHDRAKAGEFCWAELMTTDQNAAFEFYRGLFGWERVGEHDMGPMGKYLLFGLAGAQMGGMFTKRPDTPMPPAWLYYVQVEQLDARIERTKSRGGKVVNGPHQVPGGARIAQLLDPQGAVFALHEQPKP
jgi:predicted enzyme related to lactoylglutathione lyase